MDEPTMAFALDHEVRVNFGVYAGRAATPAELDRLAEWLLDEVEAVSIVAEERHEVDGNGEAVVHQVVIELPEANGAMKQRVLERADHWARVCVAERHADVTDGV